MSDVKHTEGPWDVACGWVENVSRDEKVLSVIREDHGDGPEASICVIQVEQHVTDLDEANARLIAAAPDLLEALQNLENDDNSIPEHAWGLVQSAIAKATGKEQS